MKSQGSEGNSNRNIENLDEDTKSELCPSTAQDEVHPETKKCQYCAEEIKFDAIKCKHCGSDLVETKSMATQKDSGEFIGILMLICPLAAAFLLWVFPNFLVASLTITATLIITASLAAIEANQLNFGKTSSGKKETSQVGFFFGILLLGVIYYPLYFYKRSKKGKKNLVLGSILVIIIFIILPMGETVNSLYAFDPVIGDIFNHDIAIVKNGTLEKYPQKTVGEAFDGFMGNPKWEAIVATDNNPYVNVRGKLMYGNKEVTAAIQFRIYREQNTFEIKSIEIEGKPGNMFELWALMEKMYSS